MHSPLSSLLVIELASVLAGPLVGMFCAELGARVIKVENATTNGDVTRSWRTQHENDADSLNAYFNSCNVGKESIALNFHDDSDMSLLRCMLERADVVIQNFKHGDAEKFGLDAASCLAINPWAIILSINGYGSGSVRTGYDALVQAESGLMSINGNPGTEPVKLPIAFVDILAAHQAKEAMLLALLQRSTTGKGTAIEISLMDSALASLANQATNYFATGVVPQQSGSSHPNIVPYGTIFTTEDGVSVVPAIGTDKQFASFCEILDCTDLITTYSTNTDRVSARNEVNKRIAEAISQSHSSELLNSCHLANVPLAPLNTIAQAVESDAGVAMTHTFTEADRTYKAMKTVAFKTGVTKLMPPPYHNQHGGHIRKEFAPHDVSRNSFATSNH